MKTFLLSFCVLLCLSCKEKHQKGSKKNNPKNLKTAKIQLKKVWVTDSLKTPESVLYDKKNQRLLVTNGNKNGWKMDGDGFISSIDLNGKIINRKWIAGLSSPKGMGLLHDTLYVADSKEVVQISLPQAKILKRFKTPFEDPQLNDVVIKNNAVYISGSNAQAIFKIKNNRLSVSTKTNLHRPNGLLYRNDSLFIMNSESKNLKVIPPNQKIKTLTENIGAGDGITSLGKTNFIISDWNGRLFYIDAHFQKTLLLDSRKEKMNAADLLYLPHQNLLLVPTFNDHRLMAYHISKN